MKNDIYSDSIERFLILCRSSESVPHALCDNLSACGSVEIVVDQITEKDGNGNLSASKGQDLPYIWIPDEEVRGFCGLMGNAEIFSSITAWSRAFAHIERTLQEGEAIWFVEDDVAGDRESFLKFVNQTKAIGADLSACDIQSKTNDPDWRWWEHAEGFFEDPWHGLQPLCRLSSKLLHAVLDFRRQHNKFTFHEVLFSSIAHREGMSMLNWHSHPELKYVVSNFRCSSKIETPVQGICHPVKDQDLNTYLCNLPSPEFDRIGLAQLSGWTILSEDYIFLSRYCRKQNFKKITEFGPGDSTLAFRDAGCEIISYEHDLEWLQKTQQIFSGDSAVSLRHCPKNSVPNNAESADFIFIDGPPDPNGTQMSRLQICEWALETCGCFALHDAKRESERAILCKFKKQGYFIEYIETRKGLAFVIDPKRRPEMMPQFSVGNLSAYGLTEARGWFNEELTAWQILVGQKENPVKILDVGAGNGSNAHLMLDLLFTHESSSVHCVDYYSEKGGNALLESFDQFAELKNRRKQMFTYDGEAVEILAWMISTEGYWESFGFVYLDLQCSKFDLTTRACQSWYLLQRGGMMAFGGMGEAHQLNNSVEGDLVSILGSRAEVILTGETLVVAKIS